MRTSPAFPASAGSIRYVAERRCWSAGSLADTAPASRTGRGFFASLLQMTTAAMPHPGPPSADDLLPELGAYLSLLAVLRQSAPVDNARTSLVEPAPQGWSRAGLPTFPS